MNYEVIKAIAGFLFIIIFSDSLARIILHAFKFKTFFSLRIGLGFAFISYSMFILGRLKLINVYGIILVSFVGFVSIFPFYYRDIADKIKKSLRTFRQAELFVKFLVAILGIYFVIILLSALSPPISRDALNYHLFLPKVWLQEKAMFVIPNNIYSFFPHFWELLYMYALMISNDIAAKLLHYFSLFLCVSLMSHILKLIFPGIKLKYILLSCLVFVSTPTISKISSWAYVDMAHVYYILGSLYLLLDYLANNGKKSFYLSAVCLGFALSIKYLSLLWILFIPFLILEKRKPALALKLTVMYILISLFCALPFYYRNFMETGNPFYPFLYSLFGGSFIDAEKNSLLSLYFRSFGYGYSLKDLLLIPFRLTFFSQFDIPQEFDGIIGIIYFLLALGMCRQHKNSNFPFKSFLYFPIMYVLIWFTQSQQIRFLIPVLAVFLIVATNFLCRFNSKYINFIIVILTILYLYYPLRALIENKSYHFIRGEQTREGFLEKNIYSYSLVKTINDKTPLDAKIMLLNVDPIAYCIRREIYQESILEDYTFRKMLQRHPDSLINFLKEKGVSYILTNDSRTKKHFLSYGNSYLNSWPGYFEEKYLSIEDKKGTFTLYRLHL